MERQSLDRRNKEQAANDEDRQKTDGKTEASISNVSLLFDNASVFCRLSAKTGDGVSELLDEIAKTAGISDNGGDLMINARHHNLLQTAQTALENAKKQYSDGDADEIAAFEIRNALAAYEEILGITAFTDILDSIFSTFCIGK